VVMHPFELEDVAPLLEIALEPLVLASQLTRVVAPSHIA
jgi:hypothetical protein